MAREYFADGCNVMDDGVAFLTGELEHVQAKLYEHHFPEINYAEIVPTSHEVGPWAESVSYEMLRQYGEAQFANPNSETIPFADIDINKTLTNIAHALTGYRYSLQELRVASKTGVAIDQRRGIAARRASEEFAQRICYTGDAARGLPGFVNNALVSIVAAAGVWTAATPTEILTDVNAVLSGGWTSTFMTELMNTILLPPAQFALVSTTLFDATGLNDKTVLDHIKMNNIYTAQTDIPLTVKPINQLTGAGAGGVHRMVGYRRDPDVLTFHYPMPLQFIAPQPVGTNVNIAGEMRVSGVEIRYPAAVGYSDGI